MKMNLLKHLFSWGIMLFSGMMFAQTVTGTVSDSSGPLPGATVVVKGTNNGTTADFDGKYALENVSSEAVLVVSYIGYITQEVAVNGRSEVNITLQEDANELKEVVVVGYTTQTRGDITGSVASVDVSEATKVPVANAAEALQGRVSGVTVVNNPSPGAAPQIVIRGFGTFNNTNPLYIIDGVQTDDPNVLNTINPADIEQMNVLKDGAAAIYGARASNGVVIVVTKNGGYNTDKASVNLEFYTGVAKVAELPSLLDTNQHADMIFQSLQNDGAAITHPQYDPNGTGTFTVPTALLGSRANGDPVPSTTIVPGGTKWLEELTRDAPTTNVSFSVQNGTQSGKYLLSANYLTRDGVMDQTFFKRGVTRINSEFKLTEKIRVGEHMNVAYSNANSGNAEAFENGFRSSPLIPVRDDNGEFAGTYSNANGLGNARNGVAQLYRAADNYNKTLRVFGDIYAEVDLTENLKAKTSIGATITNFDGRYFTPLDPEHGEGITTNSLNVVDQVAYDWIWSNTLMYNNTFGEHKVSAVVGTEAVKNKFEQKNITNTGYLLEDPDFYNIYTGTGIPNVNWAETTEYALFSLFGSVNYSFAEKYFLTATLRHDKTSRFLGDNASDIFPSFSAGWLISNEDFFPSEGFVSRLKLKGSWGQLGNQSLPVTNPGLNISRLSPEFSNYSVNGSSASIGAYQSDAGNPNLQWETSETTNFGVELGLAENKLNIEAEVFKITTEGMISRNVSRIPSTGPDTNAPFENIGNLENTGFDLSIGYNNQTASEFKYGITVNVSSYKNKVTELGTGNFLVGNEGYRGGAVTRTIVGEPISVFYGRNVTGFDNNGRFTYEDVDGDGSITDDDRKIIGSPHPDFTYGINLTAEYKGFDLSAFITGSKGNDIYNYNKIYQDFPTFFNGNRSTRVLNSWTPSNTNATLPALSQTITNSETNPNSYFVEDGSFTRLKNLQIGYSLPASFVDKAKLESVRIYLQGTNLFTITDYNGIDPEIPTNQNNLTLGVDWQVYPLSKIFTLGVNIKL